MENCQKTRSCSKILLCKRQNNCVIFSDNEIFFQKFVKNIKKEKINFFFLKKVCLSTQTFIYVLKKNTSVLYFCPKNINFRLVAKIQKVRGILVTVTLTVTVKNFSWENVAKMK